MKTQTYPNLCGMIKAVLRRDTATALSPYINKQTNETRQTKTVDTSYK